MGARALKLLEDGVPGKLELVETKPLASGLLYQ
jgi:hypothetical protein